MVKLDQAKLTLIVSVELLSHPRMQVAVIYTLDT
jgi:hypothetical protein